MAEDEQHAAAWYFVGSRSTLSSYNAYLTRRISGISIVVCSDKEGRIRAFENVCAHRQMPIQPDEFGRRPLICPYHAWTYDHTGQLRAVANAHLYNMRGSERASFALRALPVELVGNFVFVKLFDRDIALEKSISVVITSTLRESSAIWSSSYFYMHNRILADKGNHEKIILNSPSGENDVRSLSASWKLRLENIRLLELESGYPSGRNKQILCNIPGCAIYSIVDGRLFFIEQNIHRGNREVDRHRWVFCAARDIEGKMPELFEIVREYMACGEVSWLLK